MSVTTTHKSKIMKSKYKLVSLRFNPLRLTTAMLLFAATFCSLPPRAQAATLSWSGGGGGGNWSDSANWGFVGIPTNGDTLVFSVPQPRLANTNNISSLTLNQIRFVGAGGGYTIFGNAITLTNGIEATNTTGANVLSNNVTLSSPADFVVNVGTGAKLTLGGTLSGSAGLIKKGGGTNLLAGGFSNNYAGITTVTGGLLELFKNGAAAAAIPHDLIVGDGVTAATVRSLAPNELANVANVTVNRLSLWDLNSSSDTISALTLGGGSVTTGTGTLTLGGDLTSLASVTTASISGKLALGGVTRTFAIGSGTAAPDLTIPAIISDGGASAGITKTGTGQMTLSGTNTYTGVTTISGFVILANDAALGANGSATNGTVINTNTYLLVQGVDVGNEFLTLAGPTDFRSSGAASWAGPITLNGDVDINVFGGTFTNSGVISGVGGFTKGQAGTLVLSGSSGNTYSGAVVVNQGVLQLSKSLGQPIPGTAASLTIGDNAGGADADVVRETAGNQINANVPIIINSSGLLDLNGFSDDLGTLTFSGGHVTTGTGLLTAAGNLTANANTNGMAVIDGKVALSSSRILDTVGHYYSPDLQVNATISGVGGITKNGVGELSLTASNSFAGLTTVNDGLLEVDDSFALGTTAAGTVVNSGAVLALRYGVNVAGESLTLAGSGQTGFGALSGSFGSNSWNGVVTLASNTTFTTVFATDFLNVAGPIGGTGDVTKTGPGTLIFSGAAANTYSGSTFINAGTNLLSKSVTDGAIPHNLFIGDGLGGSFSDVVKVIGIPQIATVSDVTIATSGLLDLNEVSDGISTLSGSGMVDLGSAGTGALVLNGNGSTTYSGLITGTGGDVFKSGTGTFTLSGTNTYSGLTTVSNGKLVVNGSQPSSTVQVAGGGTLGGSGTVGIVLNTLGGVVAPGTSPGILTCSNVVFSGAISAFTVELNGAIAGSDYDQLNVRGTNSLGNCTLNLSVGGGFLPVEGVPLVILNNDGGEAITGAFNGLAEGAIKSVGNFDFRISYVGGSGNDVTLTLTNTTLQPVAATVFGGNGNGAIEVNECNLLTLVVSNLDVIPMTGVSATLQSLTPGIAVVQPFSSYADIPAASRRTNDTLFQLSALPGFACGATVDLQLAVTSVSHGTLLVPFSLASGATGSPVRFNNSANFVIPDSGSVTSSVTVVGITNEIRKVTVSLLITHTTDEDLDVYLQSPDGTMINLTSDNGGTGDDYGTDCIDGQQTVFDDSAAVSIIGQTAPFVGSFRPEQSLAVFNGKIGAAVNGTWRLIVTDDAPGGLGTLRCWSLFVSAAACTAAGGACELCSDVTLTGATGPASPTQSAYVNFTGLPSACGVPKVCPGTTIGGPYPSESYVFRNGASNACITVTLENESPTVAMLVTAYTNSYSPTNADKCLNYLADGGKTVSGPGMPESFAFNLSAEAVFVVNVIGSSTGTVAPYRLTVAGGDCRPELQVTALGGNKALLGWTTAAAGYQLESTNALVTGGSSLWSPISTVPTVINGRFNVTNNVAAPNQFYHLRKPLP